MTDNTGTRIQRIAAWLEPFFHQPDREISGADEQRIFHPGFYETLPAHADAEVGDLVRTPDGAYVATASDWVLIGSVALTEAAIIAALGYTPADGADIGTILADIAALEADVATLEAHAASTANPHSVTKAQVGLGNVDNTSDMDKPVSTAQAVADALKVDRSGDTMSGDLIFSKTTPLVAWRNPGAAADQKNWDIVTSTSAMAIRTLDDALGSATDPLRFARSGNRITEVTVNENGLDTDLRVEGDTDTNLIRADASTDRVGIGVAAPSVKLDVNGAIGIIDGMTAPTAVAGKAFLYVDSADGDLKVRFADGVTKTLATDT